MATQAVGRRWCTKHRGLAEEIRGDLARCFPSLHLFDEGERAEVRGTFPVRSPDGAVLDEFGVRIELLWDYPRSLPVVWETRGRIPATAERHMEVGGKACVLLPDARWEDFPECSAFLEFLEGPLHNFFLGQSVVEAGDEWPFGEWDHGGGGVRAYYRDLLGIDDDRVIAKTLALLAKTSLKLAWDCPCGSGRRLRKCCRMRILELRRKIRPEVARNSLRYLRRE